MNLLYSGEVFDGYRVPLGYSVATWLQRYRVRLVRLLALVGHLDVDALPPDGDAVHREHVVSVAVRLEGYKVKRDASAVGVVALDDARSLQHND